MELSLSSPCFIAHVTNSSSYVKQQQQQPSGGSVVLLNLKPITKHPLISINQMKPTTTVCNATSSITTHHSVDPTTVVKEVEDRIGSVKRVTNETNVEVELNLDGVGTPDSNTGIPFLDHMLDQLASHGLFDVHVKAVGDIHIDDHHTNEDVALAIGTTLLNALGDRKGINRFGDFTAPLDEALVHVTLLFLLFSDGTLDYIDVEDTQDTIAYTGCRWQLVSGFSSVRWVGDLRGGCSNGKGGGEVVVGKGRESGCNNGVGGGWGKRLTVAWGGWGWALGGGVEVEFTNESVGSICHQFLVGGGCVGSVPKLGGCVNCLYSVDTLTLEATVFKRWTDQPMDLSGRPHLSYDLQIPTERVGTYDTQ
ncbi:imidazoleglycerol-phosphate dehydratase, partial [Tanacetum coccineum]